MTPTDFRRLALSLPKATESAHHGHPDFRVGGKIFATLAYPNKDWGVLMLTPEQQEFFVKARPKMFTPVAGTWGRAGSTQVQLRSARKAAVREAMIAAWRNRAPQRLAAESDL